MKKKNLYLDKKCLLKSQPGGRPFFFTALFPTDGGQMAWQTLSLLLCCCQNDCVELSVTQKCEQVPTTSRNEAAAALKEKKEE